MNVRGEHASHSTGEYSSQYLALLTGIQSSTSFYIFGGTKRPLPEFWLGVGLERSGLLLWADNVALVTVRIIVL